MPGKIGKTVKRLKDPCPCLLIAATLQHTLAPGGRFVMMCEMVGPTDSTAVDHVVSPGDSTLSSKIDLSALVQSCRLSQVQVSCIYPLLSRHVASILMYSNLKLSTGDPWQVTGNPQPTRIVALSRSSKYGGAGADGGDLDEENTAQVLGLDTLRDDIARTLNSYVELGDNSTTCHNRDNPASIVRASSTT